MASSLILVGFMGAGKTTVGRLVACRLGCNFMDLDDLIVAREGRSIADIFRDSGEAYFRRVETDSLRQALSCQVSGVGEYSSCAGARTLTPVPPTPDTCNFVLALGGGAIVQPENAEIVAQSRVPVFFLDAPIEELRRRCGPHAGVRPLFADENQFRQLYESRRGSYMSAGVRIDTASLSPEQVSDEIVRRLEVRVQK